MVPVPASTSGSTKSTCPSKGNSPGVVGAGELHDDDVLGRDAAVAAALQVLQHDPLAHVEVDVHRVELNDAGENRGLHPADEVAQVGLRRPTRPAMGEATSV